MVALAASESHFRERAAAELDSLGQTLAEWERVGPFVAEEWEGAELGEMARAVSEEWPVQYRTFHAYSNEDD
jgi:hypothetical protein